MQVSVIGSGGEWEGAAEEVGRLLAERGCTVITGGGDEVMAAAARGAKQAGGRTVGILPGESPDEANEWIDFAVATGIGHARNLAVAASGEAVIAVGGSWGTIAEVAFARRLGRPTVALNGAGPGRRRDSPRRHAGRGGRAGTIGVGELNVKPRPVIWKPKLSRPGAMRERACARQSLARERALARERELAKAGLSAREAEAVAEALGKRPVWRGQDPVPTQSIVARKRAPSCS